LRREQVEKRNRAEALAFQAERQLREVALDYGMQFAARSRQRIEMLIRELRDSLERDDERGIDRVGVDLQDALYDLNREVSIYTSESEDDDFFGSVRRSISGDDRKRRERYDDYDSRIDRRSSDRVNYNRPTRPNRYYQSDDWNDDDDWL
ncbi:MAG: molecular chaperone DnaK, partial [Okeania sp. SIO2D1]|nr:molecular chaperone DnaK [Okeania sp. SIO2D1]